MGKLTHRSSETAPRSALYRAVLEAAATGGRVAIEPFDSDARARAIDLFESLGYIEVIEEQGGAGAHGEPTIIGITPLGALKLRDLRQTGDDER